ncbi:MAG TPA: roadblock/LC7 domain-containing protein [Gaiellaceae bacterium]|jgi:predicted regulator of Ras-like GTPase activity (Roadblock/LC7/MglB family)|nr:roadblock/LC7 domain-containing protein [Gaiellaceae bacterium]
MDAAQALADLTEISSQIEGAVLADKDGSVIGSTFREEAKGDELAKAAAELVSTAGETRGETPHQELVQIQAATPRGSLFVVQDDGRLVAAVTGTKPTVGLVFYDLKTCLRMVQTEAGGRATEASKSEPKQKVGKATTTRKRTARKKDEDESS